jgi:hypothetical protein
VLSTPFLYFSRPADFNDPFDCAVRYTFDAGTEDVLRSWYVIAIRAPVSNDPRLSQLGAAALSKEYRERYPLPDGTPKAAAGPVITADIGNKLVGVLCLSPTGIDPVMYYHYCADHAGVCVRFAPREDSIFWHADSVSYGENFPLVEIFDSSDNPRQFETIFLTK